ncbi:MAG: 4'-phosphopantetheinyl transferase family protein [Candidatus Sulfotelmatobacter sp.]
MNQSRNISDASFQIEVPLALGDDEVQLWRVDLDGIGGEEDRWQKLLSDDERTRAARFHFGRDRQRFAAGRAVLRIILAGYLAADPSALRFTYSAKEKPSLAPPHAEGRLMFNVSHSGGIALMAFARGREVGIDVEHVRSDFDLEAIARRFFSAHEQRELFALTPEARIEGFFRCWTRKEAYIKATGDGLSLPLSQFDVSLAAGENNALLATRPDASEAERWLLREVPAGAGFVAALCVQGWGWVLRDWS